MKKLPIDLSDFVEAMTFYGDMPDAGAYLNIKTGEIIHFMDPGISGEENDLALEERPDDFLLIKQLDSHDGFQIMESYLTTLEEGEAQKALTRDLSRPRPFRNFKDTLQEFPDLREAYFTHENTEFEKVAQRFLQAHDIKVIPPNIS
ncbi:MAG: hypothetical protein ACJAVK_000004 [Akkermansiaceae bacterium]|jgi:hypothetical protein